MKYYFFDTIYTVFKEKELLHLQGRYGMSHMAVHI